MVLLAIWDKCYTRGEVCFPYVLHTFSNLEVKVLNFEIIYTKKLTNVALVLVV